MTPVSPAPLLRVANLRTQLRTDEGTFLAVDDVSFEVGKGETIGLVGESGCGKSVTALSLLGLVPDPPGRIVGGRIELAGEDLRTVPDARLRELRGNRLAMVFQEPMTALNPVMTVGEQIAEAVRLHRGASRVEARARAIEVLGQVGVAAAGARYDAYPHQLSGGLRQRVMIAMALSCEPDLLVADEPTTALDVTIQAQILSLFRRLRAERQLGVLLITHDLGVVAETCDRVLVMYAGRLVERADAAAIFTSPRHPYTAGLLSSVPRFEAAGTGLERATDRPRLRTIPGLVPSLAKLPEGCRFRDRCDRARPECAITEPPLIDLGGGRAVACYHPVG